MMKAKQGIGPMSPEIIEAVYRYSHFHRTELMLIASKNQIDHKKGYVNNWSTQEYAEFLKGMKEKYKNSNVKICRDHCGPGFNGIDELSDVYSTIETDIKNAFDLIHIDFCHFKGSKEEMFAESKKAIEYCLKLNPNIHLEIGTDENIGAKFSINDLSALGEEIDFFKSFCKPEFYVVQTGSLVREINQAGAFNKDFIAKVSEVIHGKGLKIKEHNADYLTGEEIAERKGIVDAMNIAPQYGVIQTQLILTKCLQYGVRFDNFLELVYKGGKWKKWLEKNTEVNKHLCCMIAGHYHFASPEYKKIVQELEKYEDVNETIINAMMEVIGHYEKFKSS
ncbi:MAG: hypothetical protein QT08_C0009G0104 [archaeon GW2011_AR17]|nr:MAG: hypothetical protein QT08_C0009G0104 [archaeon GW2011_AR17]MBS3154104.1 hypothetical protein [Candidatus Woesearchaeota archaeon]HII14377.1 hypothetical protein [Nanoarchaeota archaeon]